MSLLISLIDHNARGVIMAADNRQIKLDASIENDTTKKVFKIRPGIYFGISGLTEEGLSLLSILNDNNTLPASELIDIAETFEVTNIEYKGEVHGVSFVLAGVYDDKEPFIWSRTTYPEDDTHTEAKQIDGLSGEVKTGSLVKGIGAVQISAPKHSTSEFLRSNFIKYLTTTQGNYAQAAALCIANASEMDDAISPSMDIFSLDTLTMQESSGNYKMARS